MNVTLLRSAVLATSTMTLLGLQGCSSSNDPISVKATLNYCEAGITSWKQAQCKAPMQAAGKVEITLFPEEKKATALLVDNNPYAGRPFDSELNNCEIKDALNWRCEHSNQSFYNAENGHIHHYTFNKDLTITHFIGQVEASK